MTWPVPVDPAGVDGPTKGAARGPGWRRTAPGLYVPSSVDPTVTEQRIVEALGHLPPGGALTGWPVLRWAGGIYFDGLTGEGAPRDVPLLLGPHNGRRRRPGLRYLYDVVGETVVRHGVRGVPIARALFDEMRSSGDVKEAVVAMDMAAYSGLCSLRQMTDHLSTACGVAGVPLVRRALAVADEHSMSPQESRLRLAWQLDLRLPKPLVNVAVLDLTGRLIGYPDLLDADAGLVIEYDGADHRAARRHSDDVEREARLREVGLEVTRVTGSDLRRPELLHRRLLAARERAAFEPPEVRRWTLEP